MLHGQVSIISCLSACAPPCHLLVSAAHRQEWRRNCGNWEASTKTRRERALQVLGEVGAHSALSPLSEGGKKITPLVCPSHSDPAACSAAPIRDHNVSSGFRNATDIFADPKGTVYELLYVDKYNWRLRCRCQRPCSRKRDRTETTRMCSCFTDTWC